MMSHLQETVRFWCRFDSRSGARNFNGIFAARRRYT